MKSVIQRKVHGKRRRGRPKTSYYWQHQKFGWVERWKKSRVTRGITLDGEDWCDVLHRRLVITPDRKGKERRSLCDMCRASSPYLSLLVSPTTPSCCTEHLGPTERKQHYFRRHNDNAAEHYMWQQYILIILCMVYRYTAMNDQFVQPVFCCLVQDKKGTSCRGRSL